MNKRRGLKPELKAKVVLEVLTGAKSTAQVCREHSIKELAIERGLINENPCKGVKLCGVGNTIIRYLTEEEEVRLRPFLTGRREHLLYILEIDLHTGMRRTELLSLHKSQVDFVRGSILLTHTKNGKPRTTPIHDAIEPVLRNLCEEAGPSGYLFENARTGKPITDIKHAWGKALELAGIPHIPFHCAGRHTFGTRAAEGGASLKDIQEIMDHTDIKTTMRYVHATEQGKRRAVEAAVKRGKHEIVATVLRQKKKPPDEGGSKLLIGIVAASGLEPLTLGL
jgi:integrase